MKNQTGNFIFIGICLLLMLLPFAGMAVNPTTETTENKTPAAFPSVRTESQAINLEWFSDFEAWFNDHFAFRNELVYADARIQSGVFGVSSVDNVIVGTDGWLYYASTLPDYLGTDPLSERELYGIAHNLALAQAYVRSRGAASVLAVPLNKNSLYGEHMPYYDRGVVHAKHNLDRLLSYLEAEGVVYADLGAAFRAESETLYLKRDSHWTNKGALLAYNTILDALGQPHDRFDSATVTRTKTEDGDLNRMLYTFYGEREMNEQYGIPTDYQVTNGAESVEDSWIETTVSQKAGRLLMFRDSFGNTLLPLAANQYGAGFFTKEALYRLEKQMDTTQPDTVIFEKVERNLKDFLTMPPVFSMPEADPEDAARLKTAAVNADDSAGFSGKDAAGSDGSAGTEQSGNAAADADESVKTAAPSVESYVYDRSYLTVLGAVPEDISAQADVWLSINGTVYPTLFLDNGGYALYQRADLADPFPWSVEVLCEDDDGCRVLWSGELTLTEDT